MPQNTPDWQKEIMSRAKKMKNKQLFEAMLDAQISDDWDGGFTSRGEWEKDYFVGLVKSRLSTWFKEDLTNGTR